MKSTLSRTEKLFQAVRYIGSVLTIFSMVFFILNNIFPLFDNNFGILLFLSTGMYLFICADAYKRTRDVDESHLYRIWSVIIFPFLLEGIFLGYIFCYYKSKNENITYWILSLSFLLVLLISNFMEEKYGEYDD